MPIPEGTVFEWQDESHIRTDFLDTFDFADRERQVITYETDEFSAVCPFSGLPDLGTVIVQYVTVIVQYVPDRKCVELKSLKYYYVSFRQVGIYQEAATDRIFRDLWKTLAPRWLKVTTIYKTRGGIDATCEVEKTKEA
jgi:7-cyano-7-deazaguanine reductase